MSLTLYYLAVLVAVIGMYAAYRWGYDCGRNAQLLEDLEDKKRRRSPGLPRVAEHQSPPPGWIEYMTEKAKREAKTE